MFGELPRLPAPLGTLIHTGTLFRNLPLSDRLTATSLLLPLLEHDADEEAYARYDAQSAFELFQSAGVSRRLYKSFLEPMLLVTLFAPPTQLSAAAALGALYYFALAHQDDWDVRWCRGSIGVCASCTCTHCCCYCCCFVVCKQATAPAAAAAHHVVWYTGERIFSPLLSRLESLGVRVLPARRVTQITTPPDGSRRVGRVLAAPTSQGSSGAAAAAAAGEALDADVAVLAAGLPALQRLLGSSPLLSSAPDLRRVMSVGCSDVAAVRVWLRQRVSLRSASNAMAGFDEGVGGTLFHLNQLQDQYADTPGSVLEFDLYHAEPLMPLSDDALLHHLMTRYLPAALPGGAAEAASLQVLDVQVLRCRGAATRFSPGSDSALPGTATGVPGLFVAGDCVRQGPGSHGCRGLSQEKAWVTGLIAGNRAASHLGLTPVARVLPVQPDEPHIAAAKAAVRVQRTLTRSVGGGGGVRAGSGEGGRVTQWRGWESGATAGRAAAVSKMLDKEQQYTPSAVQRQPAAAAAAAGGAAALRSALGEELRSAAASPELVLATDGTPSASSS